MVYTPSVIRVPVQLTISPDELMQLVDDYADARDKFDSSLTAIGMFGTFEERRTRVLEAIDEQRAAQFRLLAAVFGVGNL